MLFNLIKTTVFLLAILTLPIVSYGNLSCSHFLQSKKSIRQNIYGRSLYDTNASSLWNVSGGKGRGVRLIDVEKGYNGAHQVFNGRTFFVDSRPPFEIDIAAPQSYHGTAVLSIISAKHRHNSMKGLAPEVDLGFLSYYSRLNKNPNVNTYTDLYNMIINHIIPTFQQAQKELRSGDVLLVEMQVPLASPILGVIPGTLVPPTYYNSVREVLNKISQKGVYVVISAGNMGISLDHPSLDGRFDRKLHSDLIYVGSAKSNGTSLLKLESSNHGGVIDTYGPGRDVFAADSRGFKTDQFTAFFSGTSSAGAVVGGIVAQLSGIAKARSVYISPNHMRLALGEGQGVLSSPTGGYDRTGYVSGMGAAKKLDLLD